MIAYVDSSVVLRLVLRQSDPLVEIERFDQRVTSLITEVECLRAVDRVRLRGGLGDEQVLRRRRSVFEHLAHTHMVMPSRSILQRAGAAYPSVLKSLDAIHLSTALTWRERRAPDLVFATHDRQLGCAAAALGFVVIGLAEPA